MQEEMTDEKFKDLVIQYEKLVFTFAISWSMIITVSKPHAGNFLALYRHIDTYQGENYKPWLIQFASNKARIT